MPEYNPTLLIASLKTFPPFGLFPGGNERVVDLADDTERYDLSSKMLITTPHYLVRASKTRARHVSVVT